MEKEIKVAEIVPFSVENQDKLDSGSNCNRSKSLIQGNAIPLDSTNVNQELSEELPQHRQRDSNQKDLKKEDNRDMKRERSDGTTVEISTITDQSLTNIQIIHDNHVESYLNTERIIHKEKAHSRKADALH